MWLLVEGGSTTCNELVDRGCRTRIQANCNNQEAIFNLRSLYFFLKIHLIETALFAQARHWYYAQKKPTRDATVQTKTTHGKCDLQ